MSHFRADCSRCCGLCCVVPDQLAAQGFPIDKPAEMPCAHLDDLQCCSIYAARRSCGFSACAAFDCFGAGQWITQRLFRGARWTDSPETADQMFEAYRCWAPRFEAAALIEAALPYVRDDARCSLEALMGRLTSAETTSGLPSSLPASHGAGQLRRTVVAMIRSALEVPDRPRGCSRAWSDKIV
jgi:hypothetical protein